MATPEQTTPAPADQRKLQKRLLKANIKELLLLFKFGDLMNDAIVDLFELTQAEITENIIKLKLSTNKKTVAELLTHRAQAFSIEELQELMYYLQLYRTAFLSKTKKWNSINLLEPADDLTWSDDLKIITRNILQAFRIKGLNAVVRVIEHENLIWIMIMEKKLIRGKGIKLQSPIFLCYEVGTPFMFVATTIRNPVMECIVRAMQFKRSKWHHLQGRDVKSMLALLKNRQDHRNNLQLVTYQPAEMVVRNQIVDYSKMKSRESYADKFFETKEPVFLETFKVNAHVVWRDSNEMVPGMAGEEFPATLQFKSKNLVEMMKEMVTSDMIATPLPEYVGEILRSGKTKVDIGNPRKKK